FEKFTDRARRVVVEAQEEARTFDHSYMGTEHILLGLIREGDGVAAQVSGEAGRRPEPGATASDPAAARLPGQDLTGGGSRLQKVATGGSSSILDLGGL